MDGKKERGGEKGREEGKKEVEGRKRKEGRGRKKKENLGVKKGKNSQGTIENGQLSFFTIFLMYKNQCVTRAYKV